MNRDITYCASPCATKDCDRHPSRVPQSKGQMLSFANLAPDCERFSFDKTKFQKEVSWLQSSDG